jgi:hypothetical protein
MNYEKLSPEKFAINLKAGKYAGLVGARRAIGKSDWSDADKEKARTTAEKHFGGAPAVKKAVKAAKADKAEKKPAKATKPAKAVKPAKAAKKAVKAVKAGRATAAAQDDATNDPSTVRQHAAATVISAYRNAGSLNEMEQRAYAAATAEYYLNARTVARDAATRVTLDTPETGVVEEIQARSGNGLIDETTLSAEERAQHERLKKAAIAVGFPIPGAS